MKNCPLWWNFLNNAVYYSPEVTRASGYFYAFITTVVFSLCLRRELCLKSIFFFCSNRMHDFDTRKENHIVKVRNFQMSLILCVIIILSFAKFRTNSNVETIFGQTLGTLRYSLETPITVYTNLFTKNLENPTSQIQFEELRPRLSEGDLLGISISDHRRLTGNGLSIRLFPCLHIFYAETIEELW